MTSTTPMHDPDGYSPRIVLESLAGSAIGDARGLPHENLSARRAAKLLGPPDQYRLLLRRVVAREHLAVLVHGFTRCSCVMGCSTRARRRAEFVHLA